MLHPYSAIFFLFLFDESAESGVETAEAHVDLSRVRAA